MGEAAKKDSSMEDILASIRRIITADTTEKIPEARTEPAPVQHTLRPADAQRSILHSDIQLPKTGSLSALAQQIRAERNAPSAPTASKSLMEDPTPVATPEREAVATPKPSSLAELGQQFRSAGTTAPVLPESNPEKVEKPALSMQVERDASEDVPQSSPKVTDSRTREETSEDLTRNTGSHGLSLKELAEKVAAAATPAKAVGLPNAAQLGFALAIGAATESEAMQDIRGPLPEPSQPPVAEKNSGQAGEGTRTVSAFREALVSPSTQAAVSDSMDRLRHSVEDVDAAHVENILRPMLKAWLDDNLPSMVERMVQDEITRITNKK